MEILDVNTILPEYSIVPSVPSSIGTKGSTRNSLSRVHARLDATVVATSASASTTGATLALPSTGSRGSNTPVLAPSCSNGCVWEDLGYLL